jgi:hypothetical protein
VTLAAMPTPDRGLLAGLLALVVFAAGAVAMAAHAPSATIPLTTGSSASTIETSRDDDGDGRRGGRFVGFRDER